MIFPSSPVPPGAVAYGPVAEPWGVRRAYLRDPEGNLINVLCHMPRG